jgi:uncharacterized protein YchJ
MSTTAQIDANIQNAQSSTGPRTEEGKAACSKNATTHGLFTAGDFIRPGEETSYARLGDALLEDHVPQTILEHTLVDEIRRAMWRLRRCGQVEADLVAILRGVNPACILDPMETDHLYAEKVQKSVDRARAQAHRLLHKCTAELRKLQAERRVAHETAESRAFSVVPRRYKTEPIAANPSAPNYPNIARNALCPCQSGLKYKRCCGKAGRPSRPLPAGTGKDAPPLVNAA